MLQIALMRTLENMRQWLRLVIAASIMLGMASSALFAQRQRKPQRALPPEFSGQEFNGTFFEDVSSVLQGPRPSTSAAETAVAKRAGAVAAANLNNAVASPAAATADGWAKLISAATIEDTVKNSKLRLDQLVASPTKFAGGYVEARREFSLQALMFAIIEQYPGDVRWKRSAGVARESLSKMAANAKVSSPQAFKEARQRVLDLGELFNGSNLEGAATSELSWDNVIDRVPLMQLLQWAQQEHINSYVSSKESFDKHKEELQRFAELVATLSKAAIMENMPDASDADYRSLGEQLIQQAGQIVLAVQTNNAELARQAAGQVGQTCTKCHDSFR